MLDGGFLAKPHLKSHGPFAPRFQCLQICDMRYKLRWRSRHHQAVFREDFVALAKHGDLRCFGLAAVGVVVMRGAVAAFAPREHDQTKASRQAQPHFTEPTKLKLIPLHTIKPPTWILPQNNCARIGWNLRL